jgi:hypothetical protein
MERDDEVYSLRNLDCVHTMRSARKTQRFLFELWQRMWTRRADSYIIASPSGKGV